MLETILFFITLWAMASIIIEHNEIMSHICDEMYWKLKAKEKESR